MSSNSRSGSTFLQWRKAMIMKGGRKVDFDWLLDIAGGISWTKLQKIIINPEKCFSLKIPIEELEVIWESHLKDKSL